MKRLTAFISLALLLMTVAVFADDNSNGNTDSEKKEKTRHVALGLSIGAYIPSDDEIRDLFGSSSLRVGIRPLPIDLKPRWTPAFDLGYYTMSNGTDDVTLIPVTAGFIRGFSNDRKARGYVALNAGTFYGDLEAPSIGKDKSEWGFNANATLGVVLDNKWSLEGRYDYFSELDGLDFSAFTISASFRFSSIKF